MRRLALKLPANTFTIMKSKKVLVPVILVVTCLAVAAAYIGVSMFERKPISAEDDAKIRLDLTLDNCDRNIRNLDEVNADRLIAKDAVRMFDYRGDCYYEVGDYKKAIAEFEGMVKACNDPSVDKGCKEKAENKLKSVRESQKFADEQAEYTPKKR